LFCPELPPTFFAFLLFLFKKCHTRPMPRVATSAGPRRGRPRRTSRATRSIRYVLITQRIASFAFKIIATNTLTLSTPSAGQHGHGGRRRDRPRWWPADPRRQHFNHGKSFERASAGRCSRIGTLFSPSLPHPPSHSSLHIPQHTPATTSPGHRPQPAANIKRPPSSSHHQAWTCAPA
jgi:hypothetical protein